MSARDRAPWALAVILSISLLVGPALWNGFPLLQYDTGGYLARWYEGTLVPSRAVVYGLMLNAGEVAAFWPVVLVQAALTVWVVTLTLRAHGYGNGRGCVLGIIATFAAISPALADLDPVYGHVCRARRARSLSPAVAAWTPSNAVSALR